MIRNFDSNDQPRILELIHEVYDDNVHERAVKRFDWQYFKNPSNPKEGPIILVLEHESRIIGMLGCFSQRIKIEDSICHSYWTGDFMIHPEFRSSSYGLNLSKALRIYPYLMMGFPAQNTIKLWLKAGAHQFGEISEYTVYPKSKNLSQYIKSLLYRNTYKMQILDQFDDRFDQFWNDVSREYKVLQVRDRLFLTWRFLECPHLSYTILAAVDNDKIIGYSIIRFETSENGTNKGYIVDLLAQRDPRLIHALVYESMNLLTEKGCETVTMRASSSDQLIKNVLFSLNFRITESKSGVLYNNAIKEKDVVLNKADNWFLSLADSDMDYS